jgi:hypothetical protein
MFLQTHRLIRWAQTQPVLISPRPTLQEQR